MQKFELPAFFFLRALRTTGAHDRDTVIPAAVFGRRGLGDECRVAQNLRQPVECPKTSFGGAATGTFFP